MLPWHYHAGVVRVLPLIRTLSTRNWWLVGRAWRLIHLLGVTQW